MPSDVSPALLKEAQRQHKLLSKGVINTYPEPNADGHDGLFLKILKSLKDDRPLKVKLGADPTAPDIHLGHAVVLQKMRDFQECGHIAQFLIGDYTALIGDPSGRNKTRPPLTEEEINQNAKTYMEQVFKVVKKDESVFQLLTNSTWLNKLSFADTIKLCAQVTVAQIVQREDFANRLAQNAPISMHELLYPIMQGYDSVAMDCDIELGGTDQTFNCLMGRQLMQAQNMPPQTVMTLPLLVGLDGTDKMSKSKNNYIGLTDDPADMFGKVMSIPDELMPSYFELLTNIGTDSLPKHPMDAKKLLGQTLVTRFHDESAAQAAQQDFETRFSKRDIPEDLQTFEVEEAELPLVDLLKRVEFAKSNNEARTFIKQNAVKIDGEPIQDINHVHTLTPAPVVLQAGKRRMIKVQKLA